MARKKISTKPKRSLKKSAPDKMKIGGVVFTEYSPAKELAKDGLAPIFDRDSFVTISKEERQRRKDLLEKENQAIKKLNDFSQIKLRVESEAINRNSATGPKARLNSGGKTNFGKGVKRAKRK